MLTELIDEKKNKHTKRSHNKRCVLFLSQAFQKERSEKMPKKRKKLSNKK